MPETELCQTGYHLRCHAGHLGCSCLCHPTPELYELQQAALQAEELYSLDELEDYARRYAKE